MDEISKILNVARNEEDYLEKSWEAYNENPDIIYDKTAGAGYDNVTKYAKEMDDLEVYNGPKQGYPWCKVFVDWCFIQALGFDRALELLYGWTAGIEQFYNWYSSNGRISNTPKIGDLVIFGDCDHIGFVIDVDDNKVYTTEGNTSDNGGLDANGGAVVQKEYSRWSSYIKCYARPDYEGSPEPPTPPTPSEQWTGIVNAVNGLNIRSGPSTDYKIIGVYYYGNEINILEENENWGRTDRGWVCLDYVDKEDEPQPTPSDYPLGLYQVDTPSGLNVRTSPVDGKIIKAYPNGTRFDTYEIQDNWARTPSGWVCLDYCILIEKY